MKKILISLSLLFIGFVSYGQTLLVTNNSSCDLIINSIHTRIQTSSTQCTLQKIDNNVFVPAGGSVTLTGNGLPTEEWVYADAVFPPGCSDHGDLNADASCRNCPPAVIGAPIGSGGFNTSSTCGSCPSTTINMDWTVCGQLTFN